MENVLILPDIDPIIWNIVSVLRWKDKFKYIAYKNNLEQWTEVTKNDTLSYYVQWNTMIFFIHRYEFSIRYDDEYLPIVTNLKNIWRKKVIAKYKCTDF